VLQSKRTPLCQLGREAASGLSIGLSHRGFQRCNISTEAVCGWSPRFVRPRGLEIQPAVLLAHGVLRQRVCVLVARNAPWREAWCRGRRRPQQLPLDSFAVQPSQRRATCECVPLLGAPCCSHGRELAWLRCRFDKYYHMQNISRLSASESGHTIRQESAHSGIVITPVRMIAIPYFG